MLFPELRDLIKLKTMVGGFGLSTNRMNSRTQGDYATLFHGLGVEFETVRPYVIGDDVRYIDWRVTARIGKPQIKTFRAECDRNVLVLVDANAYMRFGTRCTFKSVRAAHAAALLCWQSLQQQDRIGGLVFGDVVNGLQYFKPAKNDLGVLRMLQVLCNKNTDLHAPVPVSTAINHIIRVATPQTLVFIISDFSFDDMLAIEKSLLELRRKCTIVLLPVHDPFDSEIPAMGTLLFANGDQQMKINTSDELARHKYSLAWQDYVSGLNRLSKKFTAPLLWLDTTLDPVKSLFKTKGRRL